MTAAKHQPLPLTPMQTEVLGGLSRGDKHLPSKYFYDAAGARLFERICELPEYYPTRTELAILRTHLPTISKQLGPMRWLVEPGSGSGLKTRLLLEALDQPAGYVPIDISDAQLNAYAQDLRQGFPHLNVRPLSADFTADLQLPEGVKKPVIWFPGSTLGNFRPADAQAFLRRLSRWGGGAGELLLGVDLVKPVEVLEAAYNDTAGVTARFNLNLLRHLNHAAGCDFDLSQFRHEARWNPQIGAIQMFLISLGEQTVHVAGHAFALASQEAICTEYSHKYTPTQVEQLAHASGWSLRKMYSDPKNWFGVFHLECI